MTLYAVDLIQKFHTKFLYRRTNNGKKWISYSHNMIYLLNCILESKTINLIVIGDSSDSIVDIHQDYFNGLTCRDLIEMYKELIWLSYEELYEGNGVINKCLIYDEDIHNKRLFINIY